jgi:hypothetical protein
VRPAADMPRFLELSGRLRRAFGRYEPMPFQLEIAGPILIRRSGVEDQAALERLAALDSRSLPEGRFLLAEVDGVVAAAAPIDADAEPMSDPFRPTANIRELLRLQASHVRRHRDAAARHTGPAPRALPDTAWRPGCLDRRVVIETLRCDEAAAPH